MNEQASPKTIAAISYLNIHRQVWPGQFKLDYSLRLDNHKNPFDLSLKIRQPKYGRFISTMGVR